MDNDVLNIYENDIDIAQNLCNTIAEDDSRNRAVANVLAVKLAERYFSDKDYNIDTSTGLHNIPNVLENLDIADLYINGSYVDVRVYFSNEEMSVPKLHYDLEMNPVAYMFIKLEQDLSSYRVAGFIRPDFVNKNNLKNDYYYINENDLISLYDIESHFTTVKDLFDGSKEILYSFVDGSIDESNIIKLMKTLISSKNARNTLIKAFKAKSVFKYISTPEPTETAEIENIVSDNTDFIPDETDDNPENVMDNVYDEGIVEEDNNDDLLSALEYSTEVSPNDLEGVNNQENSANEEQIDSLFTGEQTGVPVAKKKSSSGLLMLILIVIIAAGAFFVYSNLSQQNSNDSLPYNAPPEMSNEEPVAPVEIEKPQEDAMPIETVNNTGAIPAATEEASSSVAIPAIEQHLDASVLVANLKVDWEVPAGYASNTAAKRYFVKLGKVIQLNLKSELLLLNKPPISNRITVELQYNPSAEKFDIVGIKDSSGEQTVDNVIVSTIQNALSTGTTSNMESFGKLQGNPILVIHL